MIYSNKELKAEERILEFGTIYQVSMGETGRGRKMLALTCPKNTIIKNGLNVEYSIGLTKSGKPRIIQKEDSTLYLLLSSEGGYTRRGDGTIQVINNQKEEFEVLARGNGADGMAGRIGTWDCILIKVPESTCIIRVRTSGGGYGTPSELFVIHEKKVYHCHLSELEECCESLGIDIPCKIKYTDSGYSFSDEWYIL